MPTAQEFFDTRPDMLDADGEIRRRLRQGLDAARAQERLERGRALAQARGARYRARLRERRDWERANPGIPMPPPEPKDDPDEPRLI